MFSNNHTRMVLEHMGQGRMEQEHMEQVEGTQDEHTLPPLGAQLSHGALEHALELALELVCRQDRVLEHRRDKEPAEELVEGRDDQLFEQLEQQLEHRQADPHGMVCRLRMAH